MSFKKLGLIVLACFSFNLAVYAASHHQVPAKQPTSKQAIQTTININHADFKQLQTIKGLGQKKAQALLDYRKAHGNFKSADDLTQVKGINEKLAKKIANNITFN